MDTNPFVSVIIPTYNRKMTLKRALSSVVNQIYKNIEIIVVDDGSSDGSRELCAEFPQITWLEQKNSGVSAARNRGVEVSRGSWLAFLDSDDEWLPQKLQKQVQWIEENSQFSFVHCDEIWMRNEKPVTQLKKHRKGGGWQFLPSLENCCIGASTVFMSKDFFLQIGGFNESYRVCEDYHLWLKITSKAAIGFIEEPLVIKYAGHGDQLSFSEKAMDYYRIRAIDDVLARRELSQDWTAAAQRQLAEKCKILLNGYVKHNNMKNYDEILQIRDRWKM